MVITAKRIYESSETTDGYRVLVDRLWPRGVKKDSARIDRWLKEIAPSTGLRIWFNHDPKKWIEFQSKYKKELRENPAWEELQRMSAYHEKITLLFAAKEEKYNHAILLARLLKKFDG